MTKYPLSNARKPPKGAVIIPAIIPNEEYMLIAVLTFSRRVLLSLDKSLYDHLIKMGIQIKSLCGGHGTCGKCKVLIQKGNEYLNRPTEAEKALISKNELEENWRLACQTRVNPESVQTLKNFKPKIDACHSRHATSIFVPPAKRSS